MKKFQDLGKVLSNEQAQNVNGGVSVRCRSNNGVSRCRVTCSNGNVIIINGCSSVSASSINGVETVVACGVTYNC